MRGYIRARHDQSGHPGIVGMFHILREEASFPDRGLSGEMELGLILNTPRDTPRRRSSDAREQLL